MNNATNENFFEKAFESAITFVEKEFGGVEKKVVSIEGSIAKFGNAVVNEYKVIAANPEVQLLAGWFVKIAESIDPALTPLISGIELQFPKIVTMVTNVTSEVEKPIEQQLGDGLTALEKVKGIDGTVYAGALGTINASVQNYIVTNNATAVAQATPSQLLATAYVVHEQAA